MKPKLIGQFLVVTAIIGLCYCRGSAEYSLSQEQDSRYLLLVPQGAVAYNKTSPRKIPAIVLDSWQGIIWRCIDTQDEKPRWVKTELDKESLTSSRKKYSAKISELISYESKISAIVLDLEKGKAWICADIASESAKWVLEELAKKPQPGIEGSALEGFPLTSGAN